MKETGNRHNLYLNLIYDYKKELKDTLELKS